MYSNCLYSKYQNKFQGLLLKQYGVYKRTILRCFHNILRKDLSRRCTDFQKSFTVKKAINTFYCAQPDFHSVYFNINTRNILVWK